MGKEIKIEGVQSFVAMIKQYLNSYQGDKREKVVYGQCAESGKVGWRKCFVKPLGDYSIEIQKSEAKKDSLVGVFRFKLDIYQTILYQTKEEAEGSTSFTTKGEIHRHTFSLERGKWVLRHREHFPDNATDCIGGFWCENYTKKKMPYLSLED